MWFWSNGDFIELFLKIRNWFNYNLFSSNGCHLLSGKNSRSKEVYEVFWGRRRYIINHGMGLNIVSIGNFYQLLRETYDVSTPDKIHNCDETDIPVVSKNKIKIIVLLIL